MCHSISTVASSLTSPLDPNVAIFIARYLPASVPEAAGAFARSTVAILAPSSCARAKALLWACAKIAAFGESVGLMLSPGVLLHPSVIERFIAIGTEGFSPSGRRTLRTNLRFVGATLERGCAPAPAALSRETAKAPYSSAEIAAYLALAKAQSSVARRNRVNGLICVGAGAGLVGADLRHVRGRDIIFRSGGVVVEVTGRCPRVVPVLSRYQEILLVSAAFAGCGPLIGGENTNRKNITTPLISSLRGGDDLPRLSTSRLRATWLGECAQAIGLGAFMDAAGITCSQRLGDLVKTAPRLSEDEIVDLLRARS